MIICMTFKAQAFRVHGNTNATCEYHHPKTKKGKHLRFLVCTNNFLSSWQLHSIWTILFSYFRKYGMREDRKYQEFTNEFLKVLCIRMEIIFLPTPFLPLYHHMLQYFPSHCALYLTSWWKSGNIIHLIVSTCTAAGVRGNTSLSGSGNSLLIYNINTHHTQKKAACVHC